MKIRFIALALALVALTGASSEGCSSASGAGGAGNEKAVKTGTVGQPLKNAGTTYTVASVKTMGQIGDPDLGGAKAEPEATFVVVQLKLENNKKETKTFTESSAKLKAQDGTLYETTDKAVLAFGDKNLLLKDIQPGLPTTGTLAFEVPKPKLAGSALRVEDLFGDGFVEVDLGL